MSAQKRPCKRFSASNDQGFILLEVMVALSMILGVWIASVGVYQRLALNLTQQESKRLHLRKEFDAFETQEQARAILNLSNQHLRNDITRVSDRNRPVHATAQSIAKDKR